MVCLSHNSGGLEVIKRVFIIQEIKDLIKDAVGTTLTLLKIMIPVSIIVKILKETGVINVMGTALAPVMEVVGLPGDYGLVWATAMITNIYGGLVVFFSLVTESPLTVAQVTVLGVMILLAHTLPVEVGIAREAGVRVWFTLFLRISMAFVLGGLLHGIFTFFNFYQKSAILLWSPSSQDDSLLWWAVGQGKNYVMIFLIIMGLLIIMRILKKTGFITRLNTALEPFLQKVGISKEAAPLTMIGMTLGLSYGGGLIIREAKSGCLGKHDVFFSLSLMGLSHSLIEDTLLMVAIGSSLSGILIGRVLFTFLVMFILIKCIYRISHPVFNKFFIR
jgi:spore maturation protein SpmB